MTLYLRGRERASRFWLMQRIITLQVEVADENDYANMIKKLGSKFGKRVKDITFTGYNESLHARLARIGSEFSGGRSHSYWADFHHMRRESSVDARASSPRAA